MVLAVVVGAILVAVGLATAVFITRPSNGSPTPEPTPPLTGAYATANPPGASIGIDPATCALEQQPGPADPVPQAGGDLMDVADLGNGRWRLCLTGPEVLVVEGSAQCTWTDDRSAVIEIVGLPLDGGGGSTVDGDVSLDPAGVYLGLTSQAGDILSFEGADRPQQIDAAADGRAGAANFALGSVVDPEHPPSVIPADRTGTLRWSCGKPPGPRPGRATGRVDLSLDDPVAGTWHVAATCRWVTTPAGGRMQHVETDPSAITRDGVRIGFGVDVNGSRPDQSEPSLWVDIGTAGDFYGTTERPIAVRQAGDGSSGLLRFRHLTISPASDVRIAGDIRDVSGVVSWVCLPPAGPGPDVGQAKPEQDRDDHPGTATIHLDPAVIDDVTGPITCLVDRSERTGVRVTGFDGWIQAGLRRIEVRSSGTSVLVAIVGGDGQPAGEYVGSISQFSDDATLPRLKLVSPLTFEPSDPRYVPLGGPSAPRSLRLEVDYSCDLAVNLP